MKFKIGDEVKVIDMLDRSRRLEDLFIYKKGTIVSTSKKQIDEYDYLVDVDGIRMGFLEGELELTYADRFPVSFVHVEGQKISDDSLNQWVSLLSQDPSIEYISRGNSIAIRISNKIIVTKDYWVRYIS